MKSKKDKQYTTEVLDKRFSSINERLDIYGVLIVVTLLLILIVCVHISFYTPHYKYTTMNSVERIVLKPVAQVRFSTSLGVMIPVVTCNWDCMYCEPDAKNIVDIDCDVDVEIEDSFTDVKILNPTKISKICLIKREWEVRDVV